MGRNYYAHYDVCKCCDRSEVIHIGKSSIGWAFCFHATDELRTAIDWLVFLNRPGTKIRADDYEEIKPDVFFEMVQQQKEALNQPTMLKEQPRAVPSPRDALHYLDERGYWFLEDSFS